MARNLSYIISVTLPHTTVYTHTVAFLFFKAKPTLRSTFDCHLVNTVLCMFYNDLLLIVAQ